MPALAPEDLEKLFSLSVDLLCVAEADTSIIAVNPSFVSSLGYTEAELIGRKALSVIHPDDLEMTAAELAGLKRGATTLLFEVRVVTASGEVRWFQWCARCDAASGRIYASGRDITNQHMDRERLQRYADLLERTQRELKEALDELTRVANTDQLTGLLNRRAFEARAAEELSRSARLHKALGLAIFDIDRFKAVNDAYGHPTGDIALREVARRLDASRRQYDVIARWGGEEFVALFPETDLKGAQAATERMALAVAARPIVVGSLTLSIRVSGGVVSAHHPRAGSLSNLVALADGALLSAKAKGRDRIEVAEATEHEDRPAEERLSA